MGGRVLRSLLRLVCFAALVFTVVESQGAQQPWVSLTEATNGSFTVTTVKSYGLSGNMHIFLHGYNPTNILTPLATARVDHNGNAFLTFVGSTNDNFFQVQSVTNEFIPPQWPWVVSTNIKVLHRPKDQIVITNGTAFYSVVAEAANENDTNIVQYQWLKNELVINDATNSFLILTNVTTNDVAFYTVDIRLAPDTNYYRIRSIELDAPGARLYVYHGSNTSVTGPLQLAPEGSSLSCIGNFAAWLPLKHPSTGSTYFYRPSGSSVVVADLTPTTGGYSSKVWYSHIGTGITSCSSDPLNFSPTTTPSFATNYPWKFSIMCFLDHQLPRVSRSTQI